MSITLIQHPELVVAGRRLGRVVEHDERSRAYAVEPDGVEIKTVAWTRRSPIFNQGDIGSCTGNAMAGALATDSIGQRGLRSLVEADALALYEAATRLDSVPGHYLPSDTGSSGLAVAKAAQRAKFITGYRHAFSLRAALAALQSGPVIVGISWLTGCDTPDSTGLVRYSGYVRGGHEICAVGVDAEAQTVTFSNSWGTSWGRSGFFDMSWSDFGTALRQGGDVVCPTL